ncbi:MAG: SPFH domain-containing protein [Sedimentisphaerales bacterium]|nr:SPFH domain-containing protein [Sedimentisphaerales bacterium]
MRTIIFACFMGIIALVLGLVIFGRIDGKRISFNRATLEEVDTFGEAWEAFKKQPLPVHVCGGTAFIVGGLGYVLYSVNRRQVSKDRYRRKKDVAKQKIEEFPGLEIVPNKGPKKTPTPQRGDLERLERERVFFCRVLGLATLGICKFYAVPQGNFLVVTAFGKYRKVCKPGLGFIWSFWGLYQRPYKNMPLIQCKETTSTYDRETVVGSEGLKCRLDVMICYKVEHPGKALFEVDNYESAIENVVRAALRNECSKHPAKNLSASHDTIAGNLRAMLKKEVEPWGIVVRLLKISNIDVTGKDVDNKTDSFILR